MIKRFWREETRASPCITARGKPNMHGEKEMVDEEATFEKYGYYSTDLKPKSQKRIVAVCDGCGAIRYPKKQDHRDLCRSCSRKGMTLTAEHRKKLSDAQRGKITSDETRTKMSESHIGKVHTDEHRRNNSEAHKGIHLSEETKRKLSAATKGKKKPPFTDEHRQRISAYRQGIPYEDWTGFSERGGYCEKFDEACRERIREKYDRKCFLCNTNEKDNKQKLSVHHYDMNKDAGCNGVLWKLVPLCKRCHGSAHTTTWTTRIEYLLENILG